MVLPIQCTPIVTPGLKTPGKTPPPDPQHLRFLKLLIAKPEFVHGTMWCSSTSLKSFAHKFRVNPWLLRYSTNWWTFGMGLRVSGLAVIDGFFFANPGLSKFDRHPPAWHGVVPWEITKGWNSTKALQNFRDPQEFGVLVAIHWWHPCIVGV